MVKFREKIIRKKVVSEILGRTANVICLQINKSPGIQRLRLVRHLDINKKIRQVSCHIHQIIQITTTIFISSIEKLAANPEISLEKVGLFLFFLTLTNANTEHLRTSTKLMVILYLDCEKCNGYYCNHFCLTYLNFPIVLGKLVSLL